MHSTLTYAVVIGSHPIFARQPPSLESYEADVRRFISCTNHKHALHSIRTMSFAYHNDYPSIPSSDDEALSNGPALLVTLQLSLKRPFYSLSIESSLCREPDKVKLAKALECIDERIRGTFELEMRGKKFSKVIVEGITSAVIYSCNRFNVGE